MKDPFEILGVSVDATDKEIKKSYIKLSKEHHPDKGGDKEKFQEIVSAYEILKNSETREFAKKYGNIDKTMMSESIKIATGLFMSCIYESDIIESCNHKLKVSEMNFKNEIEKSNREIKQLNKVLGKIKKSPKDDFITRAIKGQIENNNNTIKAKERMVTLNSIVRDMINMYDIETDKMDDTGYTGFLRDWIKITTTI